MEETKATKNSGYSSRFALICILIGGSVGTGNLWRFPRLVGQMGGAFILVMVACVFLSALPLLYVENFMSLFKISVGGQNIVYSGECIQYLYRALAKAGALSFLS